MKREAFMSVPLEPWRTGPLPDVCGLIKVRVTEPADGHDGSLIYCREGAGPWHRRHGGFLKYGPLDVGEERAWRPVVPAP